MSPGVPVIVHMGYAFVPTLNQINPAHILIHYFFKFHLILSSTLHPVLGDDFVIS
jgi:hypothetical protein